MSVRPKVHGKKESPASIVGAVITMLLLGLGFGLLLSVPHPITQLAAELLALKEN